MAKPRKFTSSYIQHFSDLWNSHKTIQDIAMELAITSAYARTLACDFRKQGVTIRKRSTGVQPRINILGSHFGLLTVIRRVSGPGGPVMYECLCDCGETTIVDGYHLRHGATKSCGCRLKRIGKDNPNWQGHEDLSLRYWSGILKGALDRNIQVTITIKDAWERYSSQNGVCALSGVHLSIHEPKGGYQTASLDRIDSGKGYTKDNIQWIHKDLQWLKGTFSQLEFLAWVNVISNHQIGNADTQQAPTTAKSSRWSIKQESAT